MRSKFDIFFLRYFFSSIGSLKGAFVALPTTPAAARNVELVVLHSELSLMIKWVKAISVRYN